MVEAEISFVPATPGFEVLYYKGNSDYESAPVVAWAVMREENGFVRAWPVSADLAWDINEDRNVRFPDGAVVCGDTDYWPSLSEWLTEMDARGVDPDVKPEPSHGPPVAPLVLDNYRNRFRSDR